VLEMLTVCVISRAGAVKSKKCSGVACEMKTGH
jgi:hypothetical protein